MVGCWRCTYPSIRFFVSRSRTVVWQAHIQALTLKLPQDRGRLTGEHISEHSLFSWRRHSRDHGRLSGVWCGVLWWCVVVVCCSGVCVLLCCGGVCVVVLWWCVCGVWWSLAHSLSLLLSLLPLLFPFLFLSSFFSFSLAPSLTLPLALVLSLSLLLSSLFPSTHSSLLSSLLPPSHTQKKKRGDFLLQEYFRRGTYLKIKVLY